MSLQPNDHILFYGDSITDCGRLREEPTSLGNGYALLTAAALAARYPELNLRFTNRGIGGNRINDLEDRLQSDVLDEKPSVVTILIGINDTWRRYDSGLTSELSEFGNAYRRVITQIQNTGARVLILEPFLLHVVEEFRAYREDLNPRIDLIRDIAREFNTPYLPLDGIFAAASTRQTLAYWIPDGVHPSFAGHGLMADHLADLLTD